MEEDILAPLRRWQEGLGVAKVGLAEWVVGGWVYTHAGCWLAVAAVIGVEMQVSKAIYNACPFCLCWRTCVRV